MSTKEATLPDIDIDKLREEITESAKLKDGIKFPSDAETDRTIDAIQERWADYDGNGPMAGDYVFQEGKFLRVAHVHDRADDGSVCLQTAGEGSFYLCHGSGSYSGGLDYPITIKVTHVGWKPARFWLFYGNSSGAHRGVQFTLPTRVFASSPLVFAAPGQRNIIDECHPHTWRGIYSGDTLEEIQERYPSAYIVEIDDWSQKKEQEQRTHIEFVDVTEEVYWQMLECLPPRKMRNGCFLVGEPMDHMASSGEATYSMYVKKGNTFQESSRAVTIAEFDEITNS